MEISIQNNTEQLLVRELAADLETPISAYLKLRGNGASFLLESVCGGEQVARYSFIGYKPSRAFVLKNDAYQIISGKQSYQVPLEGRDPLQFLRSQMPAIAQQTHLSLPRFQGGLVGYLSYDAVRYFEPSVGLEPHLGLPEAIFLQTDALVAFDHAFGKILLMVKLHQERNEAQQGEQLLAEMEQKLRTALPIQSEIGEIKVPAADLSPYVTPQGFMQAVLKAKEYIAAGDIFQVVLSQRFEGMTKASAFTIYRALRRLNPSPYMFFFDFDQLAGDSGFYVIGASPEMHVRLEGKRAIIRPIAGTRPRGLDAAEDMANESDLLADPKERAEHIMLVDLARNDLGRTCRSGSVKVVELMGIERYSHVMHIVSQVEGDLLPQFDAFDLLRTTFPAGTVSGAPKIRAMQIIHELETVPRGLYAGAIGYFSYDGSMDTCIAIRTLTMQGQTISVQAGAGIVADSDPYREYQETVNKARALAQAVKMAENI
ncbi:MAG: anthranilate synthase component I [Anaerolineales bacterium]